MSLFQTQDVFFPETVYGTGRTHAHLVHMCWPLLQGLQQTGRSSATFGTYALVGSLKWIMRVLNSQGSRLWWLHHPSLQSRRTSPPRRRNPKTPAQPAQPSVECTTVALKYPCNPRPPRGETVTWRPSAPPRGGDCRALWGEISRGGGYFTKDIVNDSFVPTNGKPKLVPQPATKPALKPAPKGKHVCLGFGGRL